MSGILKGIVNEVNPHDFDSDWDYHNALRTVGRKPPRSEEPEDPFDPWEDEYRKQNKAQADYNKKVKVDYQDKEGRAPNGKPYNMVMIINAADRSTADNEIRKFKDLHWGAKDIVDTVDDPGVNNMVHRTVYYVDNHKRGHFTPWSQNSTLSEFQQVLEGISQADLADVLFNRLEMRYPDVVSRYGHEVVGNVVMDVAEFHAGAEELGTSDIGIMIREIIKKLENYAQDESEETVYGPDWDEKVQRIGQKAKQSQILRAKGKEPITRWNPDTQKYYVDFNDPDKEQGVAEGSEKHECGHCHGTGRMVRDPDIGTDQECFVCDGTGYVTDEQLDETSPEADDKKEWQKQNAKPKQLGKTEKYFSTRHTTKDTGAADKEQGVAEGEYNPDTFVGKKGTYKGYGITQEGPYQWGISSSVRKFSTLAAAKRHIDKNMSQGVAEGSGGNWYIRVNGKILNDTKYKPEIFSSEDEARSHAMKLADKKRIPLSQIKLTKSWMDAPEQGVAEGKGYNIDQDDYDELAEDSEPEGHTVKNSLHTIIRVATHLEKALSDKEDFPECVSEKVGSVKDQMVTIMNYLISDHEQKGMTEGTPTGMRWYKPRHVPNQNELDERMVMGASSDASSAGSKVQGEAKKSGIMKGIQSEGLGLPYPGTYEQETAPFKHKGKQERVTKIAFEGEKNAGR